MATAIVLLHVERPKINSAADALAQMQEVSEVYSVTGRYDLAAIVRATDTARMAQVITRQVVNVDGILGSETLVAFRVCSKHDMERMFSLQA